MSGGAKPGQGPEGDQLQRIAHYEDLLDQVTAAAAGAERALDEFLRAQAPARELDAYYTGGDWRRDFEDDEAGRLPAGLKRGVLSQDAVYDALTENRRVLIRLLETAAEILKE